MLLPGLSPAQFAENSTRPLLKKSLVGCWARLSDVPVLPGRLWLSSCPCLAPCPAAGILSVLLAACPARAGPEQLPVQSLCAPHVPGGLSPLQKEIGWLLRCPLGTSQNHMGVPGSRSHLRSQHSFLLVSTLEGSS